MDSLKFAVCITFHGTTAEHVVTAAVVHQVHILDKTVYSPLLSYNSMIEQYNELNMPMDIYLLFVFPDEESILLSKEDNIREVLENMNLSKYTKPMFN